MPVLDELFYRLLLARVKDRASRNPLDILREDRAGALTAHGEAIGESIRRLVALPRDALHVALVQRLELQAMASDDRDFDRVEGLERHWLTNPPETPSA